MQYKIPTFLKNRYSLVIVGFLIYITFFDAHDLLSQLSIRWKIHTIQEQVHYLNSNSLDARAQIEELTTNTASLEKFAREQYRMKRENEDIFVLLENVAAE